MCERDFEYHRFIMNGYVFNQSLYEKKRNIERIYNSCDIELIYHSGDISLERKKPLDYLIYEVLEKLHSEYDRDFTIVTGFLTVNKFLITIVCELGQLNYYFDRQYSIREWNLKLIREKGID